TQKYPTLTKDEGEVDVVVIGAGMTGLTTAYYLAKQGKSVAVIEARTRGSGQTGRSSAHIMQWVDNSYHRLESKYGKTNSKLVAESMSAAIDLIEKVVKDENLHCSFARVPGYLFPAEYNDKKHLKELDQELEACHRAGLADVAKVDRGGKPFHGSLHEALLFPARWCCSSRGQGRGRGRGRGPGPGRGQGLKPLACESCEAAEFQPLEYLNGLASVLTKKYGVKLFEMSRVMRKDLGWDGQVLSQAGGCIKAREALVHATNTPINNNQLIHTRQQAYRTYMLALALDKVEPASRAAATEAFPRVVHARVGLAMPSPLSCHARIMPAGYAPLSSHRLRLAPMQVGGSDHTTGRPTPEYYDAWAELEAFARKRWPQCKEVVGRWSGQVGTRLHQPVYEPVDDLGLYGLDLLNPLNLEAAAEQGGTLLNVAEGVVAPVLEGVASLVPGGKELLHRTVKRYIATGDSGQGITAPGMSEPTLPPPCAGRSLSGSLASEPGGASLCAAGGAIAAMVIGDHILGRPNPWAELYSPGRTLSLLAPSSLQVSGRRLRLQWRGWLLLLLLPLLLLLLLLDLGQAVALTTEGLGSVPIPRGPEDVKGLVLPNSVPHLKPDAAHSFPSIITCCLLGSCSLLSCLVMVYIVPMTAAGEGAVVQQGLQKVAVYCDPKTGELHKRSALCTHCPVQGEASGSASAPPWVCCCRHNDWYSQVEQIFGEHNTQLVAESQLEAIAFLEGHCQDVHVGEKKSVSSVPVHVTCWRHGISEAFRSIPARCVDRYARASSSKSSPKRNGRGEVSLICWEHGAAGPKEQHRLRAARRAASHAAGSHAARASTTAPSPPPTFVASPPCCSLRCSVGLGVAAEEALRFGHYIGAATKADCDKTTPHGLVDTTWGMLQQTQKYPTLTKDEGEVDVVVIGAGMVGLTVAYYLAKHGKSVAVLEGRTVGSGQTGRNPGHLMQWHNDWYSQVEQIFGEHNTQLVAESQLEAIAFVEDLIKDEEIDCGFTRVNGYLFPEPGSTDDEMKRLRDEEKVCEKAGMLDVRMVDLGGGKEVGGIREALLFPRSAEFDALLVVAVLARSASPCVPCSAEYHPLKFVNGLAEVVTRKYGVKIFEMSHVLRKELSVNGKIKAQSGGTIKAKEAVILATFTPINRNQAIHARMQPWRTYLVALAIPKGSVTPGNYWSSERKSTYIRVQKGGSQDLLLVGGRDHEHGQCVADYRDHWSELERWTRERFPQAGEVVKRWSGEVFVPIDLLGFYGPDLFNTTNSGMIPGAVMKYVATGDSGQATTGGFGARQGAGVDGVSGREAPTCLSAGAAIAARVLGDLILRKANPWCDLYSPARLSTTLHPSSLQELGRIITITCAGFGTALPLVPRGVTDLQGLVAPDSLPDLKPGEGAVVQSGLFKIALYKDDKTGVLHKMSALCTHLGSLVTWNPNDSTFDCCCHGSSYDRYGRVLSGPSSEWNALPGGPHYPLALYPPQQIRIDSFSQAFFDYLQDINWLLSMPGLLQQRPHLQVQLPSGAFSDCPICALVPGVPQDGYVHCVAGDACNKPSSYAGVAKATRDLEQHTYTYLDRSGLEGACAFATDLQASGAGAAVGVDSEALWTAFLPSGLMCCNMRTAEQFVYYLLAVALLLRHCHLYIDFAYQFQVCCASCQAHVGVARHKKAERMAAAKLKCMELETTHGVHALEKEMHHGSAEGQSSLVARGLVLPVEDQVSRYRTQVEQLTNDVHDLGLQRNRMGQSDKDTGAASNAIKAKLRTARRAYTEQPRRAHRGTGYSK
ncbi:hypothetical protein QJQ45_021566, partial [Haematococcus lacustris]